ncbi:glycosyltransferase family 2 protein [Chloroflexota bacterium]
MGSKKTKIPPQTQSIQESEPRVVAAIPCLNTEHFIGDIVTRARKYVDQVIVIDDGSYDGTIEAARVAGAVVVKHGTNIGYGVAIKSCFETARASAADVLVILDGDGQHNPDQTPRVLAPILQGEADLVIGSRFFTNRHDIPMYRRFGIGVITLLFNIGSRIKVTDAQSGFRAYSRKVLGAFPIVQKGMGVSVEVIIRAREQGFSIKEVPISCSYHSKSLKRNPIIHGLSVALIVVELRLKSWIRRLVR